MEETSTTAADNSAQNTEPTATDDQTGNNADNLDTSKSTDTSAGDDSTDDKGDSPVTKFDTDLDEWATKTGRKAPENDQERASLQGIRDGQREYARSQAASKDTATQLDKVIQDSKPKGKANDDDDEDPVVKRQDALESQLREERGNRMRSEYFSANSVSAEEAKVMGDILKEKSEKGGEKAFAYWTDPDNLSDWHDLAKARLVKTQDTSQIEAEAAQKERARIAKESQANGPGRSASNQTDSTKTEEQKRLERFKNW